MNEATFESVMVKIAKGMCSRLHFDESPDDGLELFDYLDDYARDLGDRVIEAMKDHAGTEWWYTRVKS